MIDEYGHDHLIAIHQTKGYTCNISRAMSFCRKRGNHGCCKYEGSEPLESCHCQSTSAGWAEGTLGAWLYMVLMDSGSISER